MTKTEQSTNKESSFVFKIFILYGVSICCRYRGQVKHIAIMQSKEKYYGFAENYTTYPTLMGLVNHYHKESLEIHNKELKTTLMFPIKYTGNMSR